MLEKMSKKEVKYLLPVGVSDYQDLVNYRNDDGLGYLYSDKSFFIKEIFADGAKVLLITRPRRFGKTLALSMLRYFFAKEVDNKSTAGIFDGTIISNDANAMKQQGKYPVIFISLKGIKGSDYNSAKSHIAEELRIIYGEFKYLLENEHTLREDEREIYKLVLAKKSSESDLQKALYNLTLYLNRYHDVAPMLLIDEYDTPIQSAYMKDYYSEMSEFMRGMFEAALKDNKNITKAILTGITRVAKESLFSGVNNFEMYTLLDKRYKEYFGFTESEVNDLFKRSGISLKEQEIKNWYNGYQCNDLLIYNPWSIIKCLNKDGEIDSYWVNSSGNELASNLLIGGGVEVHEKLEGLLRGDEVIEELDAHIVYNSIKNNRSAIWTLMFMAGYLKVTSYERNPMSGLYNCKLELPNNEVRYFYRSSIQLWLSSKRGGAWFQNFIYDLLEGKIDRFEKKLKSILIETFSFHDVGENNQESFYHGFMLGLIAVLQDSYILKSNRESGTGRYDISITPRYDKNKYGIILEFKAIEDKKGDLSIEANKALRQINDSQYITELQQAGFNNILKLGVAFSHKNVAIAVESPA